jgi:uncharacterized protein (TIGR03067 family)
MIRAICIVSTALLLCSAAIAADAPKADDPKAIEGTWVVVSMKSRGEAEKMEGTMTLTFAGDKVTLKHEDRTKEGKVRIDATTNPKQLDITPDDKDDAPMKGIYELTGDSLKICTVEEKDGQRPASFDSKVEKKAVLLTLKRQK